MIVKSKAAFTLMEALVVISIIGILAAVAVPSMISLVDNGRQQNRMNIARTLYLATQNQLSRSHIDGSLKAALASEFFMQDADGFFTDVLNPANINLNRVSPGVDLDDDEKGNNDEFLRYVSKPAGYVPGAGTPTEDAFYRLLDEIILDKDILNDAILMEYNIKTGVVLSIFYGDAGQTRFDYGGSDDRNNVSGGRSIDNGYQFARERRQGFYGVASTGEAAPLDIPDTVNIFDGLDKPLPVVVGEARNVLYAEFLLFDQAETEYTFEIVNTATGDVVITTPEFDLDDLPSPGDFETAIMYDAFFPYAIYFAGTVPYEISGITIGARNRYIWVIDYIEGDISNIGTGQPNSIGKHGIAPQDVRARATRQSGASTTSLTIANTHFAREMNVNTFEIKSPRHLNNIRYALSYADSLGLAAPNFRQTNDINMNPDNFVSSRNITNFAPIVNFKGDYYAMGTGNTLFSIDNLRINIPSGSSDVGLFAQLSDTGTIRGLMLKNPEIRGNIGNTGALIGTSSGTVSNIEVVNPTVVGGGNVGGIAGIAGTPTGSSLSDIYIHYELKPEIIPTSDTYVISGTGVGDVGGIAGRTAAGSVIENAVFLSAHEFEHVQGINAGGITGRHYGTLNYILFLAMAPVRDGGGYPVVYPFAGTLGTGYEANDTTLYYLCGKGVRPEIPNYNTGATNGFGKSADTIYLNNLNNNSLWNSDWSSRRVSPADAINPANPTYPYPFPRSFTSAAADAASWPITAGSDIIISNFYYFERYGNDSQPSEIRLWAIGDEGDGALRNDRPVIEAGYKIIVTTEANPSGLRLFARPGTITAGVEWEEDDLADDYLMFTPSPGAPYGFEDEILVYTLDLEELAERLGTDINTPLQFAYGLSSADESDLIAGGYLHPRFAKAIVTDPNIVIYEVRTPWQMQNISLTDTGTPGTPATGGGNFADPPAGDNTGVIRGPGPGDHRLHDTPPDNIRFDNPNFEPFNHSGIVFPTVNITAKSAEVLAGATGSNVRTAGGGNIRIQRNADGSIRIEGATGTGENGTFSGIDLISIAGDATLTGDFSGINIRASVWGRGITLGTETVPFTVRNSSGMGYIHSSGPIKFNISGDFAMENVTVFARNGIEFESHGSNISVSMNAAFYSENNTIHGTITGDRYWNPGMIPQFYQRVGNVLNLTLTGDGENEMGGIFYNNGNHIDVTINNNGRHFNGLFLARVGSPIDIRGNATLKLQPNMPSYGLDPAIAAYLYLLGWRGFTNDPPGSGGNGGTPGTPTIRKLTFLQGRDINFTSDVGTVPGSDGTTPFPAITNANAVITIPFCGTYDGMNHTVRNVTLLGIGLPNEPTGLFSVNHGIIRNLILRDFTIAGNTAAGGIAGINNGTIESTEVHNINVYGVGVASVGGLAGINNGDILRTTVSNSVIRRSTASDISGLAASDIGTMAATDDGGITESDIGIMAATDDGGITETDIGIMATTDDGGITETDIGTMAATGDGGIIGIDVGIMAATNSNVSGTNAGGITGTNRGEIKLSAVQYSTVADNIQAAARVGGIAGSNEAAGSIEDVFFLSTANINNSPVSNNGGGIVGHNTGDVEQALYLAPAPSATTGTGANAITTIYPIVRSGNDVPGGVNSTNFFLAGHRYIPSTEESWNNEHYNRDNSTMGGERLITNFMDMEWFNDMYAADFSFHNWYQPARGYPYPLLRHMPLPHDWPQTDSPVRPDQVDRRPFGNIEPPFEPMLPTANRAGNVGFINGDFSLPLMNPMNSSEIYEILRIPHITDPPSSQENGGEVNGGFNSSFNSSMPPEIGPHDPKDGRDWWGMYIYYNDSWVQGWNTRPVDPAQTHIWSNCIEFQRPYPDYLGNRRFGRVRTNWDGTTAGTYLELNAEIPGTLYQITSTVPNTELYYSFYHARRHNQMGPDAAEQEGGVQRMNFYLSGMVSEDGEWIYTNDENRPNIIRPCITPRGAGFNRPTARNSVVYGTTSHNANETVIVGRVDFFDPNMNNGAGGTRNAYLYDVWVANTTGTTAPISSTSAQSGYGITFWSDTLFTIGNASTNQIPLGGVRNITGTRSRAPAPTNGAEAASYYLLPAGLINAARDNVIGYWDVANLENVVASGNTVAQYRYHNSDTPQTYPPGTLRPELRLPLEQIYAGITFIDGYDENFVANPGTLRNTNPLNGYETNVAVMDVNNPSNRFEQTIDGFVYQYNWRFEDWGHRTLCIEALRRAVGEDDWHWFATDNYRTDAAVVRYGTSMISEWKQYYGIYIIPDGQVTTEFAFESGSDYNPDQANYLANVTFESPGFLSIEKDIKSGDESVMYVRPNDTLTVELAVRNWGESSVNNIVIEDRLAPYDAYIEYVSNPVTNPVTVRRGRNGPAITGLTITAPAESNGHTLTIALPADTSLAVNEELLITFNINIKEVTPSPTQGDVVSTLQFYFRNQAVLTYYDADYWGYSHSNNNLRRSPATGTMRLDNVKRNASGPEPVQVFIDPITLSTNLSQPLGDTPFRFTMTIENPTVDAIITSGNVSFTIPADFIITNRGSLPEDELISVVDNPDKSQRITIRSVGLDNVNKKREYYFDMQYDGAGYGVVYPVISAAYRCTYRSDADPGETLNVMLRFPQPVVGIPVKAEDISFGAAGTGAQNFVIPFNEWLSEPLTDDNYNLDAELVLLIDADTPAAKNPNGEYQITEPGQYIVRFLPSTRELVFEPQPGFNMSQVAIMYQILVDAERAGSPSFELHSEQHTITLNIP